MRRAILALGGTVAGLAALLSFKSHPLAAPAPSPATPPASAGTSQAAASGTGSSSAAPAVGDTASAAPKASTTAAATARTVTGTVVDTQRGPMQVQVTLTGTRITKVTVLQRTDDGTESDQIDATAIPKLTSETLVAQSARIDAVSGATYTSSGYIQSLQSALDQANT
jgi:uncharacterized protein with FMN-binding domain